MKNLKPRRHPEERENGIGSKNCLQEHKDDETGMGVLCREMEDWYRGEENRSMAGAA